MSKTELKRLWKSQESIKEILLDRGLPEQPQMTFLEFSDWAKDFDKIEDLKEAMEMLIDTETSKTMVFWSLKPKLGTNIRDMKIKMDSEQAKNAIVICENSVTVNSKRIIRNLKWENIYIHVYTLDETQINISNHSLVPKHEICTREEKREVMTSYSITAKEIPKILTIDPMVRHLKAVKGQLIKICRPSETQRGKTDVTYRIVV